MWTMGILLVTDILDEHKSLTNLVSNGNSLVWGGIGWCVILLCIIFVGYHPINYVRKYIRLKRTKAVCESEKEKIRIKLDRANLNKEKKKGEFEQKKRILEKELKGRLDIELKLRQELKKNSVLDFKNFFTKSKKVERNIEELLGNKKDLEEEIGKLEEQMGIETKKCIHICEKLQKEVERCEEQIEAAESELEDYKKIFKEKMKKKVAVCVMMLSILLVDGNNMLATAQELKDTLVESFDSLKESQVNESETEEAMSEDIVMENEGKNVETSFDIDNDLREHMDYNFILEDEQLHKVLDDDIADIILLKDYSKDKLGFEQFLIDCRQGNMIEILPEINYDKELGLNGLLNEIAKDLEMPLLEKINKGNIIRTQIEWEQSVPKSAEIENIINKRRQALGMEDSVSIRRTIYFRLANDYQRLGKECIIQGKDGTDIYYYYGMSIYCCYCALEYERVDESSYSDEEIMNYVKARYRDIIDNVKMEILRGEVNSAEKIYLLIK